MMRSFSFTQAFCIFKLLKLCVCLTDMSVRNGTVAVLPCQHNATDVKAIEWSCQRRHDGEDGWQLDVYTPASWTQENGEKDLYLFDDRYDLNTFGDLDIDPAIVSDSGRYECHYMTEMSGSQASYMAAAYFLTVTRPPSVPIMHSLIKSSVEPDIIYNLSCLVKHVYPKAKVLWVVNGEIQTGTSVDTQWQADTDTWRVTGILKHQFSREPHTQELTCWVTSWDDATTVISKTQYKTVQIFHSPIASIRWEGTPLWGSSHTLICHIDADPEPGLDSYSWWKDKILLVVHRNTLIFHSLDHTIHDGLYECERVSREGRSGKASLYFRVYYLTSVHMVDFSPNPVVEGQTSVSYCYVRYGYPRKMNNITWKLNGREVLAERDRIDIHDDTLEVKNITRTDSGKWSCTGSTDAGTMTSPQQILRVKHPPQGRPLLYTSTYPVRVNENATLMCDFAHVSAFPLTFTFAFYQDATLLQNTSSSTLKQPSSPVVSRTNFTCVISNPMGCGEPSETFVLEVAAPAVIEDPQAEFTMEPVFRDDSIVSADRFVASYLTKEHLNVEGEYSGGTSSAVVLSCLASGYERAIRWTKNGQNVPYGVFTITHDIVIGNFSYGQKEALQEKLIWRAVQGKCGEMSLPSGMFACIVITKIGGSYEVDSQLFQVNVKFAPTRRHTTQSVVESDITEAVTLECDVCANPPPIRYQWQKDGRDIQGANDHTLTVQTITGNEYGSYTCTVVNDIGTSSFQIDVVKKDTPLFSAILGSIGVGLACLGVGISLLVYRMRLCRHESMTSKVSLESIVEDDLNTI